jgi:two-component system CheB/CheR fusion protein
MSGNPDTQPAIGLDPPTGGNIGFLVVGVGASAGGITALKHFFSRVSEDSGIAYVVILHLSPQHLSNLAAVLQSETRVPVTQVTEAVKIQPDHVYVIPPTKYLTIQNEHIELVEPVRLRGGHTSIDLFFRSLADAYRKDAVAIILSGTGADGTLGLGRIKENGGFAIAQDPAEAEYDGMPRNAIDTGLVDLILPAAEIPDKLRSLSDGSRHLRMHEEEEHSSPEDLDFAPIREILAVVRQQTGHDFSQYKPPTLLRRIERRLQVHEFAGMAAYLPFLRGHPEEISALLRDLLITVTNFFRDRDAFAALEQEVVPKLFEGKAANDVVRVWAIGCATGEEAYSIAILLCEYAARLAHPPRIQIFATDIDESAIADARECRYPHTIALDVSPERLRQFFIKAGDEYRVKKELRELILFAAHNVLRDPPFSKLDLVTCRNLLIYLNRDMQERVLSTCHFALSPDRYLFLGSSESAEGAPSLFLATDKKHRLYTRRAIIAPIQAMPNPSRGDWNMRSPEMRNAGAAKITSYGELHQRVVEQMAPPSCLINEDYDIVHMSEHTGRYLRFRGGEPSRNLLEIAHPEMRLDLRALLLAAKARNNDADTTAESRRLCLEIEGKECVVDVSVRRVGATPAMATGFFLVIFDESTAAVAPGADQRGEDGAGLELVSQLEDELQQTRDQLHLTIEQYETSNEELKASNEELQAINEELRSTTEELETSKEELQSLNEELTTVNQELREKIEELGRVNSDLQNLMSSTDIGTIFLDRGLQIKRYTARAQQLFNITPLDIGRPLEHFTHKLDYQALTRDAEAVLQTLQSRDREVHSSDDRWYLARLLPYRTLEDKIDGVVLNFVDITEHKHAEELRRQTAILHEQSQILGLANVFIRTIDDRIELWNTGCERLYGYGRDEALARISHELLATEFPQPLDKIKAELLANGSWEGELVQGTRAGERISVASRWVLHHNDAGEPSAILEVDHDLTDRKRVEEELRQTNQYKDQFLASLAHELRNPLAAILSSLELLNDSEADDQETMQLARGVMDRQLRHLMRLVDDLLDLERLRRGRIALHKERVEISSAVNAALETARSLLEPHKQALTVSIPPAPLHINADRVRFTQILTNLLDNAAKYTAPGGRIELTVEAEGEQAVIRVRDTGIGISTEALPNIFDFFVQEQPSSESNRRGIGVGLALCRQLVELHDGTIEARSAGRGKGSEFIVRLPLAPAPLTAVPAQPDAADQLVGRPTRRRLLVIDDERDVADSLASLLRKSGHEVSTAYSGQTGIEAAIELKPDTALVDIAMPDLDGYEVARRLRVRLPGILLIAISGLVQEPDRARARQAGFDYHLAKPATAQQIEEIFAKSAHVTPKSRVSSPPSGTRSLD